jgi:hypothetical protein
MDCALLSRDAERESLPFTADAVVNHLFALRVFFFQIEHCTSLGDSAGVHLY